MAGRGNGVEWPQLYALFNLAHNEMCYSIEKYDIYIQDYLVIPIGRHICSTVTAKLWRDLWASALKYFIVDLSSPCPHPIV